MKRSSIDKRTIQSVLNRLSLDNDSLKI